MRILCTFVGGYGHFEPLLPIANAARAAGHTVAVAGSYGLKGAITAAGFEAFSFGRPNNEPVQRLPLLAVDMQREEQVMRDAFADRIARQRTHDTLALCAEWHPDLIISDEVDFGGMVAAEVLGLPHATVVVLSAGGFVRPDVVAEPLNRIRAEHGLAADPTLAMISRDLVLAPLPPRYRDPAFPLPPTTRHFKPLQAEPRVASQSPNVYFTLGTVFNTESGDLFQRVLAGLRELPITVIATVGNEIDPAEFGLQPANVRIERYIPQAQILRQADLVISHGGSGSVTGALAYGLPMLLIPMGADQPLNARRCVALGVAETLDAMTLTPGDVGAAVTQILDTPSYHRAAQAMAVEIASQPDPASIVPVLEQLLADKARRS